MWQCDLSLTQASSASFFENNLRHKDGKGADRLVHNAILGKNVNKAGFESDLENWNRRLDTLEVEDFLRMRLSANGSCISWSSKEEKWSVVQFIRSSSETMHGSNIPW